MPIIFALSTLDQHDVVLFLRVDRLNLQRDRLADEVAELSQALRLLVEKKVDHRLRGKNSKLSRVELLRLAHDLAQDLVANRLRGLDFATPTARHARLAEDVREALAGARARHLDQAKLGESVDRQAGAIAV